MKKTVLAFVAVLSLALLLAGCGQTTSETTQTAETPATQETTTQQAPATETTTATTEEIPAESTPSETTSTETSAASETTAPAETIEVAGCSDTDGGKDYETKGSLVDARAVTDMDRCSSNENYPGRLYEAYCKEDGNHGRETYDCPSGSCMDGACVAAESSSMTE